MVKLKLNTNIILSKTLSPSPAMFSPYNCALLVFSERVTDVPVPPQTDTSTPAPP